MTQTLTRVRTTVNGAAVEFLCEPRQSLLECVRDILGLTGTKEGCNDGNCGACTVIMDGRIVNSCLVLGVEAEGRAITTIEGIAQGSELHPIQRAFLENAAVQCGFCTPESSLRPRRYWTRSRIPAKSGSDSGSPIISAAAPAMTRSFAPSSRLRSA